jgi:hypothetical protein
MAVVIAATHHFQCLRQLIMLEIELLHEKIDQLREREVPKLTEAAGC